MVFRSIRRALSRVRRNAKSDRQKNSASGDPKENRARGRKNQPTAWERVLTESMRLNCVAPSEEAVLHAYDLYRDGLYASHWAREKAIASNYADIAAEVATLRALVPSMIERAMARHPYEFTHLIDHTKEPA